MLKVIVVDDEATSRDLLRDCINSFNDNFLVVGVFDNGKEAFDYIQNSNVDVVITDIAMPIMDGLQLAKRIHTFYPHIKTIIVSAYAEFEYAKKAIEYNTFLYLVKPIDVKQLYDSLLRISHDKAKELRQDNTSYTEDFGNEFFRNLIFRRYKTHENAINAFVDAGFSKSLFHSPCILTDIEFPPDDIPHFWKHGREGLGFLIKNLIRETTNSDYTYLAFVKDTRFVFITFNAQDIENYETKLREAFMINFHISFIFNRVIKDNNLYAFSNYMDEEGAVNYELSILASSLLEGNTELSKQLFTQILELSKQHPEFQDILTNMINLLDGNSENKSLNRALEIAQNLLINKQDAITNEPDDNLKARIIKASKEYIEKNYWKDITRDDTAEAVFLSQSYFSRLFKRETGLNFSDYLNEFRIKKAIQLLEEGVNVNEVHKMVGINQNKYFIKTFKKVTLYTPKEYVDNILKHGDDE